MALVCSGLGVIKNSKRFGLNMLTAYSSAVTFMA